jgi:nicotinate-nucleotide adenylyltransferase
LTQLKNISSNIKADSKIGLFGGTFDPVHTGHLIIAETVRECAGLDLVIFIPAAHPPHKQYDLMFSAGERFEMLSRAVQGNEGFTVTDIEMNRSGPSYTIDTIREMKAAVPPGVDMSFILGKDNLHEMSFWKDPQDIVRECKILVADRRCDKEIPVPGWLKDRVRFIKTPLIDISSSDIRLAISEGRSIRYLVPGTVLDFICNLDSPGL